MNTNLWDTTNQTDFVCVAKMSFSNETHTHTYTKVNFEGAKTSFSHETQENNEIFFRKKSPSHKRQEKNAFLFSFFFFLQRCFFCNRPKKTMRCFLFCFFAKIPFFSLLRSDETMRFFWGKDVFTDVMRQNKSIFCLFAKMPFFSGETQQNNAIFCCCKDAFFLFLFLFVVNEIQRNNAFGKDALFSALCLEVVNREKRRKQVVNSSVVF